MLHSHPVHARGRSSQVQRLSYVRRARLVEEMSGLEGDLNTRADRDKLRRECLTVPTVALS